jgi:hypothetical protein
MNQTSPNAGERTLALLLMVGGVLGVGISIFTAPQFLRMHWIYGVLIAGALFVFVWSALTGYRLWRGEVRGWKWAAILFALQIPILTVPGFSYEYYTGVALQIMGGHVDKTFTFSLGSNANLYLDTRIVDLRYGVNLFAIGATIFLLLRRPNYRLHSTRDAPASEK